MTKDNLIRDDRIQGWIRFLGIILLIFAATIIFLVISSNENKEDGDPSPSDSGYSLSVSADEVDQNAATFEQIKLIERNRGGFGYNCCAFDNLDAIEDEVDELDGNAAKQDYLVFYQNIAARDLCDGDPGITNSDDWDEYVANLHRAWESNNFPGEMPSLAMSFAVLNGQGGCQRSAVYDTHVGWSGSWGEGLTVEIGESNLDDNRTGSFTLVMTNNRPDAEFGFDGVQPEFWHRFEPLDYFARDNAQVNGTGWECDEVDISHEVWWSVHCTYLGFGEEFTLQPGDELPPVTVSAMNEELEST